VHKLRVAVRRAQTTFWCLKHSTTHLRFKKLSRHLHKLEQALGRVRELDVAIEDAKSYEIDSSSMKLRRKLYQKKLRKLISKKKMETLLKELNAAERVAWSKSPILLTGTRYVLGKLIEKKIKHPIHSQRKLHSLRIDLKKIRYALEALGKSIDPIKPLQTLLGDAHDLEVLQKLSKKSSKAKIDQRVLNEKSMLLADSVLRFSAVQLKD
jgi:CHAD domain-containing protein